jgi:hypothetical protein
MAATAGCKKQSTIERPTLYFPSHSNAGDILSVWIYENPDLKHWQKL